MTKEHNRQVRDNLVELFKVGFNYKTISQDLIITKT